MLQMVFDGISDPLVMLGKVLEIRLLNKAAYEYYPVGQEEVIGKPCHQAFKGISDICENCEIPAAVIDDYAENHENFELFGMTYPQFREDVLKLLDSLQSALTE